MDADEAAAAGPMLVEPARTQLLDVASDVLGRLAAEDVPPALRPVARFAPAKRRRFGATALSAALDGDEGFRERVADVVAEGSPELARAVREGTSTAAADPLDVAIVAYLLRPPGWELTLAGANARWTVGRADAGPDGKKHQEFERMRAELTEWRGQVKTLTARLRDANGAAAREVEADVTDLRRSLRERTRELRAAERERDDVRADAERERADADRERAAQDAELRRLRARVAELERTLETSRRDQRVERNVDDARLWLLVDTVVRAANGLRTELALAAPTVRPGDVVGAASGGASEGPDGGRSATTVVALDRLLALPDVHLIVDGYNVTKTGYGDLALVDQRARLVGSLAGLAAQTGAEVTIAFDGGDRPPAQPPAPRGVRVLFSVAPQIADDLIRSLVAAEPAGRPVVVVSSDGQVAADTARGGAWVAASDVLLARL